MNDKDMERFEAELQQLRPAPVPEGLRARLRDAALVTDPRRRVLAHAREGLQIRAWRWWLVPTAAAAALALSFVWWQLPPPAPSTAERVPESSTFQADEVQIEQRLIAAFEAVARLPDGEPVRFRCREWQDEVMLRDSAQGVVIQRSSPRFEVVPVRFETF